MNQFYFYQNRDSAEKQFNYNWAAENSDLDWYSFWKFYQNVDMKYI